MENFVILTKNEEGKVIESTIPLPKDYIEELVPPFPVDSNIVIEPYENENSVDAKYKADKKQKISNMIE